jgi:hypothetical protein
MVLCVSRRTQLLCHDATLQPLPRIDP